MKLQPEQWKFFQDSAKLKVFAVDWAVKNGYTIVEKEVQRTQLQAWANGLMKNALVTAEWDDGTQAHFHEQVGGVGKTQSLHLNALARDWILFKDGKDVSSKETMKPLGEYWKSLDPVNRWGGDFILPRPDPYHFERNAV
jgi:hypothetical protein